MSWSVVGGRWQVAGGRWQVAEGGEEQSEKPSFLSNTEPSLHPLPRLPATKLYYFTLTHLSFSEKVLADLPK